MFLTLSLAGVSSFVLDKMWFYWLYSSAMRLWAFSVDLKLELDLAVRKGKCFMSQCLICFPALTPAGMRT